MARYRVEETQLTQVVWEIEANSEEQARELAHNGEIDPVSQNVTDSYGLTITEIEPDPPIPENWQSLPYDKRPICPMCGGPAGYGKCAYPDTSWCP